MALDLIEELRARALRNVLMACGLVQIAPSILETLAAETPEGRAAAEIQRLRTQQETQPAAPPPPTASPTASPKYKSALAACARWEAANILEWVTYHRSIGFEHIYIYCNDDDPTELYEKLSPLVIGDTPYVTFLYFPFIGLQTAMFKHFLRHLCQEAEWFMFLDIDEFLALKRHEGIREFIQDYGRGSDAVYFNWVFFGHNGHVTRPAGSVLLQYVKRGRYVSPFTKTLTRTASLNIERAVDEGESGFWHYWKPDLAGDMRRVNVLKDDMAGYYGESSDGAQRYLEEGDRQQRILQIAAIYHFAFRSEGDIDRRIRRGVGGDFQGQLAFKAVADRGEIEQFLDGFSQVEDTTLRDYWLSFTSRSWRHSVFPPPPGVNIALGKSATQSSISVWSNGQTIETDAARAVSGTFSGQGAFHTDIEACPWWRVDLAEMYLVQEVRIYNRMDNATIKARASKFRIQVSPDGHRWETAFSKTDDSLFGGVDGDPFIWRPSPRVPARFVQVQLLETQFLHLDQVEVYGDECLP